MVTDQTRQRGPVIGDVARLAGVSAATASRVLTGSARVSEEKRQRVLNAISELNFSPNVAASTLAGRQRQLVSVLAGSTYLYGNGATLQGISEAAGAADFTVSITLIDSMCPDAVKRAVALTVAQQCSGMIVLEFDNAGSAALDMVPKGMPVVSVAGDGRPGIGRVALEEEAAAFDLTSHMLDLGHETVVHVKVPSDHREDGRTIGWRKALKAHGAPVPRVRRATWDPASGRKIGRELAKDPTVTAVFCGNDEIAMGLMAGAREGGREIPATLSVAGFDDHPLAAFASPPLSTVRQDFFGLGRRAFDLLYANVVSGENVERHMSETPTVVLRDSLAPPPR